MFEKRKELGDFEYIIVGTGPGGAPVALSLAKAGKSVAIVEKGAYHKQKTLGVPFGMRTVQSLKIDGTGKGVGGGCTRGFSVGGSSLNYNGNIMEPPAKLINRMGIDFSQEAKELKEIIGIAPLPDRFYSHYRGCNHFVEAADQMGINFEVQDKAIDPDRCVPGCDWCMYGCKTDAKWTTRGMIDEAVAYGATLLPSSPVEHVIFNETRTRTLGVRLEDGSVIRGSHVVLAAGGVGSPAILLRSGIKHLGTQDVGTRFFFDPMWSLIGFANDDAHGGWGETTFTHAIEQFAPDEGFIIGNVGGLGHWMILCSVNPEIRRKHWNKLPIVKRCSGLFVKLGDTPSGTVSADEKLSKVYTDEDNRRGKMGIDICREIMEKVGVDPKGIMVNKWFGGHPGGTLAMGGAVNTDFSTEIDGLYVCDASVMPQSPGVPPVLTITSMGRLLGKMLTGEVRAEDRLISDKKKKAQSGR